MRIPDADRVKHRLSVATFQNDEQGNCCPSGNRYQRQTDGSRIANERDWQKWWRLAGLVRNVRPSKGVTRTVTPCRMLTNANVENIMGVANRYPLATDRKQKGVNETGTPLQGSRTGLPPWMLRNVKVLVGNPRTGKERLVGAKIKISYEKPEELKQIVAMLSPVMRSCKVAKGQQGRYKKAYVEIEGIVDNMPQENE